MASKQFNIPLFSSFQHYFSQDTEKTVQKIACNHAKIKFKNTLIKYPDLVNDYTELKKALLKKYKDNRFEYTRNKSEFIQKVLEYE